MAFHVNVPDKVSYACRLLRKAYLKGSRCRVVGRQEDLLALDSALWTRAPGEFLAHSTDTDPPSVRERSSIHLGYDTASAVDVLVLLGGADAPADTAQVERVIEVVSADELDREQARARWKRYRQQGIEPTLHDLAAP